MTSRMTAFLAKLEEVYGCQFEDADYDAANNLHSHASKGVTRYAVKFLHLPIAISIFMRECPENVLVSCLHLCTHAILELCEGSNGMCAIEITIGYGSIIDLNYFISAANVFTCDGNIYNNPDAAIVWQRYNQAISAIGDDEMIDVLDI